MVTEIDCSLAIIERDGARFVQGPRSFRWGGEGGEEKEGGKRNDGINGERGSGEGMEGLPVRYLLLAASCHVPRVFDKLSSSVSRCIIVFVEKQ